MRGRSVSKRVVGAGCLLALLASSWPGWAEAGIIRGTIIDREGKPASGAKVWAAKISFLETLEVREATTDDAGVFSLEASAGDWAVFAAKGDAGGRIAWNAIPKVEDGKKDPAPVTVRLGSPTTLKGRLVDAETGKPIAGGVFALNDARRVTTDADGRFSAPGLAATNHEAYTVCDGYERKRILFDTTARPDAELDLKLRKAGKVIGRVLDANGKPVPGATVGLSTSGSIFSGSALWEKCNADGTYSYDGKPLGRTGRLSARAPGFGDTEREDVVVLDPAEPTVVDFTLRPEPAKGASASVSQTVAARRKVSGTVVGPNGKPVADALVRWDMRMDSNSLPETKTDAKGEFLLDHMPDEPNILSIMAKGLVPSFPIVDAGGDQSLKVELKTGATIRGRVVDDAGAPIEGIRIAPQINNPKPNHGGFVYLDGLQATTDRDGRFALEGMPEGVKGNFVGEGWNAERQHVFSPSDESKNVVVLRGAGAIRGRVVDPAGRPVRNFRVQVNSPKVTKPGDPAEGGFFAGYVGIGLTFTRDDGEFTISGLSAGSLVRLTVIADGYGEGEADRVLTATVRRLNPAEDLTIKLNLPHTLRVQVFKEGGKPIEGASVTIIQSEGQGGFMWGLSESSWEDTVSARVDAQGWADFPALSFRKGIVVVRAKGFSRAKLDWLNDEDEFNVFLEPESKIVGTVVDDAGKPLAGAMVMLSWGKGEMTNVPIDDKDGRFVADGLGSGKYSLNVMPRAGGQGLAHEVIDLEPGKTLEKEIVVKRPKPAK